MNLVKRIRDEVKAAWAPTVKDPREEILEKINAARANFREQNPGAKESPWDSCNFLEFKDDSDTCWLNPGHQRHLNFGWFTVQELQDWLEGKIVESGIIKSQEHWDELNYLCKTGTYLIAYEMQHFNRHPTEFLRARGERYLIDGKEVTGEGFPKRMQLPENKNAGEARKLSPEMVKVVEGHIKWIYRDDFKTQLNSGKTLFDLAPSWHAREEGGIWIPACAPGSWPRDQPRRL